MIRNEIVSNAETMEMTGSAFLPLSDPQHKAAYSHIEGSYVPPKASR